MASRVHIHVHVSDLPKSRAFYEAFLGAPPVKEKPGYAKFLPDLAPINLALSEGRPGVDGPVDHVGVQVDSTATVMIHLARVKAAGLAVREQMAVNCCHANQDKFWVQDPDGLEWEVYHLNYDLEDEADTRAAARSEAPAPTALPLAQASSCCAPSCCAP